MPKVPIRVIAMAAGAASIALLLAATIGGKDSRAEVFVTSVGALGQVWIALMLWHLTRQQFEHLKTSSEREARISSYALRSELLADWEKFTLQIGYTTLNRENVRELRRLRQKIGRAFGQSEENAARRACEAAMAAQRRARLVEQAKDKPSEDAEYREHIDLFRVERTATWRMLKEKIAIEN